MAKRYFCLTLIFLCLIGLYSCKERRQTPRDKVFYDYFDTVIVITGYEEDGERFNNICGELEELIARYHRFFDIYNDYDGINNIKTVNDCAGMTPVTLDDEIIELLIISQRMYDETDGQYNPAMGAVLSIWHDYRERAISGGEIKLPPYEELSAASAHCSFDDVIIDIENKTVYITDSELSLDLGAAAKGFAAGKCAEYLWERGFTGYAVNLGGTVVTVGSKPGGDDWRIGIEDPSVTEHEGYAAVLAISDMALVTSGSYQRYYELDGVRYHHIIDPETLMPENTFVSVSILTRDPALGDALSTALFNMSFEDGLAVIESMAETEALWMFPGGELRESSGFDSWRAK